jgi:cardiolipin synthase
MHANRYTYATLITLGRLLCVLPVVYAIKTEQWVIAFSFFIIAAATDGLDGFIARTFDECTFFGAALDACVDKIMIIATLCSLIFFNQTTFSIPMWFLGIIATKEILQLVGVLYIYRYVRHFEIKPLLLGKITMALYVILIAFFLYAHIKKVPFYLIEYYCAFVSLVACMSFCEYFLVAYRYSNSFVLSNKK